jgi:hypothetical protein
MTTLHAEPITHEHDAILRRLDELLTAAREMPNLTPTERCDRRDQIVAFVEDVLLPHAKAEERGLYEQVGRILGHPEATAPMVYDHIAIREWTARLAEASADDVDGLQEVLYGLHALVVEHFRKEEELYEPLLDRVEADESLAYDAPALRHDP